MRKLNDLTHDLIGAAIEVHRSLGPGLLESAYEAAYCHELGLREIRHLRQKPMPITYKGVVMDCGYRLDVLAEDQVIVELKSVEKILPIHEAQLLTYLKLAKLRLGLLINFNVVLLKDGIQRLANNLSAADSAPSAFSAVHP
jgi:GxxExxY protein